MQTLYESGALRNGFFSGIGSVHMVKIEKNIEDLYVSDIMWKLKNCSMNFYDQALVKN